MSHRLRVVSTSSVNPAWWGMPEQVAEVMDAQTVKAYGVMLKLENPADIVLIPGQKAFVRLGRDFYLETEQERIDEQQAREDQRRREEEERRANDRKYREEARAFNASLNIPVQWVPGIKDVLSGLSANSWGDGRNAATVEHILLQEDLHDGRLQRKEGDFLCTSAHGNNGKNWSWQKESVWIDSEQQEVRPKVTCKACLKIAERWS